MRLIAGITAGIALLACLCVPAVCAGVIYVKWDSPNNGTGTDWDHAYHTVTAGVGAAVAGDEVWVAKGTYVERITLKVGVSLYGGFVGIDETLRSQRNWRANATVLDANRLGNTIIVPQGASPTTVIDGFRITKSAQCGSEIAVNAVYCDRSSPTISNNIIIDNGTAVYASSGSPVILCNEIRSNFRVAIYCVSSQAVIANNVIAINTSGGILLGGTGAKIVNNTIVGNTDPNGSGVGVSMSGTQIVLANNIIAFNSNGVSGSLTAAQVLNNCVFGNTSHNYSGLTDQTGINGNIKVDPKLANGSLDAHIQPDSLCRDAGSNAYVQAGWTDIDGQPRIQPAGGIVDIGADESDGTVYLYVAKVVIEPSGGIFTSPIDVKLTCSTPDAEIHYTINGGEPTLTDPMVVSGGTVHIERDAVLKARAFKTGWLLNETTSASFTITGTLAAPTFDPAGGDLQKVTRVRIDCTTPGATIYYTLNDAEPTTTDPSIEAVGSVRIDKTCTLKAFATKYGWIRSATASTSYTMRQPTVLRVKQNAPGPVRDGTTWDTAFTNIHAVEDLAIPGDQIWVAGGRYTGRCFFYSSVSLLGGFRGDESTSEQREPHSNVTTIDGGITIGASATGKTLIDGFTICNGSSDYGGGIYGSGQVTASNNVFKSNSASQHGGGVYNVYNVINNIFEGNTATINGGAIYGGEIVAGNVVRNNRAKYGGGLAGGWRVQNNLFVDNIAVNEGGGVYRSSTIANNTFIRNKATYGGGAIYDSQRVFAVNNIIAYNSSGIFVYGSSPGYIRAEGNCVYQNDGPDFAFGHPSDPPILANNISLDPMFVNMANGDYHLLPVSPGIDAGVSDVNAPDIDMDGNPRPRDGNGDGTAAFDIGCYEAPANYASIAGAKALADGLPVGITCGVSTAVLADRFYVEATNRSIGIGVLGSIPTGKRVTVEGSMTTVDGERILSPTSIVVNSSSQVPGALAMNTSALGGGASGLQGATFGWSYQTGNGSLTRTWGEISGINNIGLLVRTSGRVTEFDTSSPKTWFKIDDGSGVNVKCVVADGVTIDPSWQWVGVTGISSCKKAGAELHSMIRVRSQGDITPF